MPNINFWKDKKVFITGHTGFKGGWASIWLQQMGARLKGYSLPPPQGPSLFEEARVADGMVSVLGDIRDLNAISEAIEAFEPEIIVHMAAQPLVRESYTNPVSTFETNVMGTVNVLQAARNSESVRAVLNVTSDKCYQNNEWSWGYRETEPMGGHDPYSSSKGCSELVTAAFRKSFFNEEGSPNIATARAGNVIGGGDWAEDRLIPDALRAFDASLPVLIRYPSAVRPWQHVLEPVSGYLRLIEKLFENHDHYQSGWNFGPKSDDVQTVAQVLAKLASHWGGNASWKIDSAEHPHEACLLKLDTSKAEAKLGWTPTWDLETALSSTVAWYKAYLSGGDMRAETVKQILEFERVVKS